MSAIGAVLLDIDGTLTDGVGGPALPGAVAAVRALMDRVPVRYVTNTTSKPRRELVAALAGAGFPVPDGSVVTPTGLAERVLTGRGDTAGILLAPDAPHEDLGWFRRTAPGEARAVLVADESHALRIADLAPAVEALLGGARLYTLQQNRVFRRAGRLVTDLGPVAAFLGYAAKCGWENCGKPSALLFETLAHDLGVPLGAVAMVGDDAEFDASGAVRAGCGAGVLVKTGKYRLGDEHRVQPSPTWVLPDLGSLLEIVRTA